MGNYDWPLMAAQHGGENFESFLATLLRRKYVDARQVNPSQGDKGVDIVRDTTNGIEVWQVKAFTTALNASQFNQIKKSWRRFFDAYATAQQGEIARYHLVTPWTPTEERLQAFAELTKGASFPCQWDGEAYLAGLADEFPETLQRYLHGDKLLERFVSEKALLACSPVEQAGSLTMIKAAENRFEALDSITELASDNYHINYGTRSIPSGGKDPFCLENDPSVLHKMKYLGDSRWMDIAVVPRTSDSTAIEPMRLEMEFIVKNETPEQERLQAWQEWGIPFTDVPAKVQQIGGPLADEEAIETVMSISTPPYVDDLHWFLACLDMEGISRFQRLPLTATDVTMGPSTGWKRVVLETPCKSLNFDLRIKPSGEVALAVKVGDLRGSDPELVRDELTQFLRIAKDDILRFELSSGTLVFPWTRFGLPPAFTNCCLPVAQGLINLQVHTSQRLIMPDVVKVTPAQLKGLEGLVSIFQGNPQERGWSAFGIHPKTDVSEDLLEDMAQALQEGGRLCYVDTVTVNLGEDSFLIDHPLMAVSDSARLNDTGARTVSNDDAIMFDFDGNDTMIVSALPDWDPTATKIETPRLIVLSGRTESDET